MTFVTFLFFIITSFIVTHQSTCGQISATELSSALQPTPYVISTLPPLPTVTPSQIFIPTPAPTPILSPLPSPSPIQPPGIVKGVVFDNENGNPIKGAKITVRETSGSYTTGNNGIFFIQLDAGTYTLRTKATGYRTKNTKISIGPFLTLTKNIGLKKKKAGNLLPLYYR